MFGAHPSTFSATELQLVPPLRYCKSQSTCYPHICIMMSQTVLLVLLLLKTSWESAQKCFKNQLWVVLELLTSTNHWLLQPTESLECIANLSLESAPTVASHSMPSQQPWGKLGCLPFLFAQFSQDLLPTQGALGLRWIAAGSSLLWASRMSRASRCILLSSF